VNQGSCSRARTRRRRGMQDRAGRRPSTDKGARSTPVGRWSPDRFGPVLLAEEGLSTASGCNPICNPTTYDRTGYGRTRWTRVGPETVFELPACDLA
jgi:hypothetical protein